VVAPLAGLTTAPPALDEQTACLIVQTPNFLGYLEEMRAHARAAEAAGALLIAVVDPLSLAVLAPPGSYGAAIAVGDGQVLGNPTNFGGPHFGFMVVDESLLRQMPGRLVGETVDAAGARAFVLTLQAREQHIRRSKAKSNICSNHQLTALMAAVNMSALGPQGLRDVAVGSVERAHRLADALQATGARVRADAHFFNEFVLETRQEPRLVRRQLARRGVHAGVPVPDSYGMGRALVLAATELTEDEDIGALIDALAEIGEATPEAAHG
jgi:glycine dehydrogenase subunit 1